MLRLKLCFLTVAFLLATVFAAIPRTASSNSSVVRLTNTPAQAVSLNPSLSDDGRTVIFESSANFFAAGLNGSFHAIRADVRGDPPTFQDLGSTRIVSPALSSDGSVAVFASYENLVGENADRNSEIFLLNGSGLKQITHTEPRSSLTRVEDGNFEPSITADGRLIVFSNPNLVLYETDTESLSLLGEGETPKISGDGSRVYYRSGDDLVSFELATRIRRIVASGVAKLSIATGRAVTNDGMRFVYAAETAANQSQVFLYDARVDAVRQLTQLGSRSVDVNLSPTISGDGKRVAFATRRRVTSTSDGSVELYLYDIPTGQVQQITNAPASATAEVVSSLNFDGSLVAFNFARLLSGPAADDSDNNSEIYLASIAPRPEFGTATVLNAAALGNEPDSSPRIAPGSIASIRGSALAGSTVAVNGKAVERIFYTSPQEVIFAVPDGLADGPAEFVATNADGFSSKAQATISAAAPGVFTVEADGRGDAILLDADTQTAGPFDPTSGRLRLAVFATGVSHARSVSVTINGQAANVETVAPSGLRGLDEIHVLVPAGLRGAGKSTLLVNADGVQSNAVSVVIGGSSLRDVVVNEILADPPDGIAGDANRDGVRDTSADEFVELVNSTTRDLDISGYQLQSRSLTTNLDTLRHRFAPGTILFAGTALVVFGDGSPAVADPVFGGSQIVKASTGGLSLVNSGGVVTLRTSGGEIVTSVAYGSSLGLPADQNQSLTRAPDVTGDFSLHSTAAANGPPAAGTSGHNFSPGTKVDGSLFVRLTPAPTPTPIPSPTPTPTPISPPKLVLTQIFGGGGNAGAPYRNDFIELFNAGHEPVNLTGWSVQYASATASTWSVTPLSPIILAPGQYYLVQQASGGSNGIALPQPDATGTIAMAAGSGKVALAKTSTALTGACPSDPNIVDLVGYGATASCFRGAAPATAPSNTNAIIRALNGCADAANNNADFSISIPKPRNLASPVNICAELTAGFDIFKLVHALSHRRNHATSRTFWLRQLPRRPT